MTNNTSTSRQIYVDVLGATVFDKYHKHRNFVMDVLRGFALLGILLMNIDDFATPEAAHDIPVAVLSGFKDSFPVVDLMLLNLKWIFFEGKMRGLFSMLFGAGTILLTTNKQDDSKNCSGDIYGRRNIWLLVFGLLHGCFLWYGDILFDYALVALIVLRPLRNLKPKTLIIAGSIASVICSYCAFNFLGATEDWSLHSRADAIHAIEQKGNKISSDQEKTLQVWNERVKSQAITKESVLATVVDAKKPYWEGVSDRVKLYIGAGSGPWHSLNFFDSLGLMLIGMGLFKLGFLTGELRSGVYVRTAVLGFLFSTPIYLIGLHQAQKSDFDFFVTEMWLFAPYYFTREAGTLAMTSVVILIVKCGYFRSLATALSKVGKTALTNYIMTTVLCKFIFIWCPQPQYGKIAYYQLTYIVFGIWCLNLALSSLWLRFFRLGPLEWVWRSLTYAKLQPMLLVKSAIKT
jgi:uncharacterized protein